jgi:BlaI family penicillinase repressor
MSRFTPGELEVMQVLWEHGSLKPAEIQDHMPRAIRNAALRSVLRVLMAKEHVTRRKVGKAYYYRSKRSAETVFRKMTRQLANVFCGGSTADLIAQLIKSEKLSDEDIRQLQRLAETQTSPSKEEDRS